VWRDLPDILAQVITFISLLSVTVYAYSKNLFEKNFGIVLETYAVNSLNSRYYFKKGNNEIIPVEIKVSFNEEDMRRFSNKIHSINAKIGIIILLNQEIQYKNIKVIPAYKIEKLKDY
jgi:hypothetical protein